MELLPLGERIIVRKQMEEVSSGGIIMTSGTQETSKIGTVIATGEAVGFVKVGDEIVWARYSGTEIMEVEDYRDCLLMNEQDILAKVKK